MSLSMEWIGGFFDADGSITLSKRVRNRGPKQRIEYVPALALGQSDPGILEQIARQIGGGVHLYAKRGTGNSLGIVRTRDSYVLRADNQKAITACRLLIPVTHCKRRELEEVVAYYETYNNYTKGWARWQAKSDEYARRYATMISEGDACRARLNLLRQNKDTLHVTIQEEHGIPAV